MNRILIYMMMAIVTAGISATAQQPDDGVQADLRTGPVTVQGDGQAPMSSADYGRYPFLDPEANSIVFNGADWSALRRRIEAIDDTVVSIVHIGDSHLQAEGATQRTRALLQSFYGSSGRGLITPFKLAGTNQPTDYTIKTSSAVKTATVMRRPWALPMGFTGIAISPEAATYDITITTKDDPDVTADFDVIKVYGHGPMPRLEAVKAPNAQDIKFKAVQRTDTIEITVMEPSNSVTLRFTDAHPGATINGFKLENSMTGIEYHVIGNNGARYDTYNSIGTFGADIRSLSPDLIIVSLGTNEAFGYISDAVFYGNIDRMVRSLTQNNPEAQILLVTPAECWKQGRVNTDVKRLRNVILQYGRDTHIATYDWYQVAGGDGCSVPWIEHGLLSADRIHNTWPGYHLQGNLMYDALVKAFNN